MLWYVLGPWVKRIGHWLWWLLWLSALVTSLKVSLIAAAIPLLILWATERWDFFRLDTIPKKNPPWSA